MRCLVASADLCDWRESGPIKKPLWHRVGRTGRKPLWVRLQQIIYIRYQAARPSMTVKHYRNTYLISLLVN